MRKTVLAIALALAVVALVAPGAAQATESHTYTTVVPCAVACPYWTDPVDGQEAACLTPPISLPGSFSDWVVTIPSGFSTLHWEFAPRFDYDSWMCYHPSNPGPNNTFFIETGANNVGEICPTIAVFGCAEEIDYCISAIDDTCVAPGKSIIFRVYNWSDAEFSIIATLDYLA